MDARDLTNEQLVKAFRDVVYDSADYTYTQWTSSSANIWFKEVKQELLNRLNKKDKS